MPRLDAGTGSGPGADGSAPDASPGTARTDAAASLPDAASADAGPGDAAAERDASGPPVVLPQGARAMFPLPGAIGLCNDPALRVEFSAPPSLGTRGKVQVFRDDQPGAAVASIDLGAGAQAVTRGGQSYQQLPAAHLDGNAAVFALPPGALQRGQRYHVTLDQGVLRGPEGPFAISDATTWRFETAPSGPSDPTRLVVGLDGKAPFCTVQAALDAVPARNQTPTTIEIGAGSYFGLVHWSGKSKLTLRGADRARSKIAGINNNNLNPSTRTRSLVGVEASSDVAFQNLTIHNLTPQGGSQAEALALLDCDRCSVRDTNVLSLQDTLLWTGRVYAENCFIAGNVDFIWGGGAAFFKGCEIKTVGRSGYIVQSRNGAGSYGFVFVDSKITSDPGISGAVFARIDASVYPASNVALIDCQVGPHISAAGWTVTNAGAGGSLRFWEYGSKDAAGNPVSTGGRSSYSRQLTAGEAAMLRDPAQVLGGWKP